MERLYGNHGMTKQGLKFQDEVAKAIEPVIKKWAKKKVCGRDMENIMLHIVMYRMCLMVHLPRTTPWKFTKKGKRR